MVTQFAERQDTVFKALADPTRRNILSLLRTGEQPVNTIARGFPVRRPAISKHLRLLLEAELVYERREGRNRVYHLNAKPLHGIDDWLEDYRKLWQVKLQNLKRYLEAPEKRKE